MKAIIKSFLGVLLLAGGLGIVFLVPERSDFLVWIIIAISTFMFCIGYYWMGALFNRPMGRFFHAVRRIVFCAFGIFLIIFGCRFCYLNGFNTRGMAVATEYLIYGIAMQLYAFGKLFNQAVDGIKTSERVKAPLEELYAAFKDVDTPMGRPWLGKVKYIDGDCLIYGPTDAGSFLYGYYLYGSFAIGESSLDEFLLDEEDAAAHTVETTWDRDDFRLGELYHLLAWMMPDFFIGMFEGYAATGRARCDFLNLFTDRVPNVYIFDEIFAVARQRYRLLDLEGNETYYLHGALPFWTFHLERAVDGAEAVMSKRVVWNILFPTYDIYMGGEKYGRMSWKFRVLHTTFKMKTRDGEIAVREITATIGDQFGVYRNGALIGTISQKISLKSLGTFARDMIFDNFVLMAFDEKDLPLVASLTVMLGSFKNHGVKKG